MIIVQGIKVRSKRPIPLHARLGWISIVVEIGRVYPDQPDDDL